jgi:hypothetical protein
MLLAHMSTSMDPVAVVQLSDGIDWADTMVKRAKRASFIVRI